MNSKIRRILWAIDPLDQNLPLDPKTVEELSAWAKEDGIKIEPVYVLTNVGTEPISGRQIESSIKDYFATLKIPIESPTILVNPTRSVSGGVQCLVEHAEKVQAGLVVVSSHGRTGLARMTIGSFAEALLTVSPVPLLFMNHKARRSGISFKKALWSTTFSEHCNESFKSFLRDASGLANEIILFHDVSFPVEMLSYAAYAGVGMAPSDEALDEQKEWAVEESKKCCEQARRHGFQSRSIVGVMVGQVAGSILKAARENEAGLVVMASAAGPVASVLLGGEAHSVFRSGELPVWVYGPRASKKVP